MKKLFAYFILVTLVSGGCEKKSALEVFETNEGAINGYDPVSYHKGNKPVKGNQDHTYQWKGATWYFTNEENLSLFKTDPERYAPQFGGYCAYGMADGHKAPTQPDAWTIVNDKLYFNYNKDVLTEWKKNKDGLIKQAEHNWPTVKKEPF